MLEVIKMEQKQVVQLSEVEIEQVTQVSTVEDVKVEDVKVDVKVEDVKVEDVEDVEVEDVEVDVKVEDVEGVNKLEDEMQFALGNVVKKEMIKTATMLINEIDLLFEYVDKKVIKKLEVKLMTLKNDTDFNTFVLETRDVLSKYEDKLSHIIMSKGKIKTNDYEFLQEIKLFDGLLDFGLFKMENKNTKKTLVQYIYDLYMACFFLKFEDGKTDEINNELLKFIESIKISEDNTSKIRDVSVKKNKAPKIPRNSPRNLPRNIPNSFLNGLDGGMDKIMGTLLNNPALVSFANDITKDLENTKINPMTLLSGLMSGKPNNELNSLVQNISSKLEEKINSGEIDKGVLEEQASSIASQLPMLKNILGNLPKNL